MTEKQRNIVINYVCPAENKDLYVNGLWGGVTPRGEIYAHFYSERHPIPQKVTHMIEDDGKVSFPGEIEKKADATRIVQASLVMDVFSAKAIRDWFNNHIEIIEKGENLAP